MIVGAGTTVKLLPLDAVDAPDTATVIRPVVAVAGTVAMICVAVADVTVAAMPLNETVSFVFVVLKFVPVIVTLVPVPPVGGLNPEIVGARVTVKVPLLVAVAAPTVTVSVPVVAPVGTVAMSCVVEAEVTAATVP